MLLLVAALVACDDSFVAVTTPPAEIVSLSEPIVGATLARDLIVELDRADRVRVVAETEGRPLVYYDVTESLERHEIDLVRLWPDHDYTVTVVPEKPNGRQGQPRTFTFRTDPLPAELAALDFTVTGSPSVPLTMLEITVPQLPGGPIIVDARGDIVWYREGSDELVHGLAQLPDAEGFVIATQDGVSIVRPDGTNAARLDESDAAARTGLGEFDVHHDVIPFGDGVALLLVEDTATVGAEAWTGEALWTWDYEADVLEKRWSSFDQLSPATHSGDRSWTGDWLHANSISVGPRGNVVVSFFWTHEVVSVAPDFGSLEWSLGGPASSFTVADGAMDAGQHTAVELSTDRVLLFDNGLDRPDSTRFSRAIELRLDQQAATAEVVWEYRPSPDIFAPIVSSARRLANGNTVVAFGTAANFGTLPSTGPIAIHEVTPAGAVVWTLEVGGAALMYRATPLETIGGEYTVPTVRPQPSSAARAGVVGGRIDSTSPRGGAPPAGPPAPPR